MNGSSLFLNALPSGDRLATLADSPDLDNRPLRLELQRASDGAHLVADIIVINMGRFAAFVTDEKDAIMLASGMAVGEIGIGAFDPHRQIVGHEQVQYAVNTVGRHPLASRLRQIVGNIIG